MDWKDYPKKLNFEVIRKKFYLEKYQNKVKGFRHLSRIFDLQEHYIKNTDIMYVDSDVFFFKNPLPLKESTNKFCWNFWNTGFFYYNPEKNIEFFDVFKYYTMSAIHSVDIRNLFKKYVNYDSSVYGVCDEMVLNYMRDFHPNFFKKIQISEHAFGNNLFKISDIKMIHLNSFIVPNPINQNLYERGLICLYAEELYNNICKVFTKEDLIEIFGEKTFEHCSNKRFNIEKNAHKFIKIKTDKCLFHINYFLKKSNKIISLI
jgi:RNAse (barnase) inhibitor barstar